MKKLIALFAMAAAVVGAQAAEVSLKVDGLVCEKGCLTKVKKSLGDVKGVNLKGSKFATGKKLGAVKVSFCDNCLLYTSPSPRDLSTSRMPSSA